MSSDESVETIKWSKQFNSKDGDVTFVSSDGVRFRIHSVFLRAHSEALSPEYGSSLHDPAPLSEPSVLLNLLFDFIYPNREPTVELKVDFDTLLSLSEAAAKYQVFPALYVCIQELRRTLPNHAFDIFTYGYRHELHALVNEAVVYAIDSDPADVIQSAPGDVYKSWIMYRQTWTRVQTRALADHVNDNPVHQTVRNLAKKLSSLADLNATFGTSGQSEWRAPIEQDMAKILKFTEWIGWKETDPSSEATYVGRNPNQPLVIIETSDGSDYHIPLDILRACTTNLGGPLLNAGDNLRVKVPEGSSTIALLLRFIKPVQYPDLESLEFVELKNLALAAEKYSIRQAKGLCRVLMMKKLGDHPHDVFHYAADAHYLDILDETAPLVLGPINSFNDAIKRLPPRLVSAWVLYYQQWQDIARIFLEAVIEEGDKTYHSSSQPYCECRYNGFYRVHLLPTLPTLTSPGRMRNLDLLTNTSCARATQVFDRAKAVVKEKIDTIPSLSSFL